MQRGSLLLLGYDPFAQQTSCPTRHDAAPQATTPLPSSGGRADALATAVATWDAAGADTEAVAADDVAGAPAPCSALRSHPINAATSATPPNILCVRTG